MDYQPGSRKLGGSSVQGKEEVVAKVEDRIVPRGAIEVGVRKTDRARAVVITVTGRMMYTKRNGRPSLGYGDRVHIILSALGSESPLLVIPDVEGFKNDHFVITRIDGPAGSEVDIYGENVRIESCSPAVQLLRHGRPVRLENGELVLPRR